MAIALFEAFPGVGERVPWRALGEWPTRLDRVDGVLPPSVELWLKRDDRSAASYGGNKVRKLEFLLADALARGRRRVVTTGAWGSHHVLATAIYGRAAGVGVDAVVFPQPLAPSVLDHLLADVTAGARLVAAGSYAELPVRVALLRARRGVGWIAAGGSSPVGTMGWVSAGMELAAQAAAAGATPDVVYAALGSCGTVAGLWLGLGLAGYRGRVVGVRVVDRVVSNRGAALRLARATRRRLERAGLPRGAPSTEPPLVVEDGFFGAGYAHPTAEGAAAAEALGSVAPLEPTYTGKAFAAVLADARAGRLDGQRVVFVDTFSSAPLAPHLPATADERAAAIAALPSRLRRLFVDAAAPTESR